MKVERNLTTFTVEEPKELSINEIGKDLFEIKLYENIEQVEKDGEIQFHSKLSIVTTKCKNIDELKGAMVKLKYNQDQEYAVMNKGIISFSDYDYQEYRDFVSMCKTKANEFWENKY